MFKIGEYFKENDFLRVADAEKMGISRAVLSQMAKSGELQRVAHGVVVGLMLSLGRGLVRLGHRGLPYLLLYSSAVCSFWARR